MKKIILYSLSLLTILSSCVKDTFDDPGSSIAGNSTLISIKDLRAKYTGSAQALSNLKIRGIVISDKDNGNISSLNMVIQDQTGGIMVRFASAHNFVLNDSVEVVLAGGASLEEFKGTLQANYVPNGAASKKGTGSITPRKATLTEVNNNFEAWESTLIELSNVTIAAGSFGGNRTVSDASANITMYTMSAASFSSSTIPTGQVTVVGYLGEFSPTKQIQIRNSSDVTGGSGGGGGGTFTPKTIAEIRALHAGVSKTIDGYSIEGVVISDKANNNTNSGNIVVQDASGRGIVVRISGTHNFALNDQVKINISNDSLTLYRGLLQLNTPIADITKTGTSTVTAKTVTINEINSNMATYESTLVKVLSATISGGTTYGTNNVLTDGSASPNTITLYTAAGATFTGASVPTGAKTVTGIVGVFNTTKQLMLRNTSDVQ
jgi:DNA/RNA endonuclease YhcR with UshA esterase domain